MLTLETKQDLIQIFFDVQAASKVADEKCKRNVIISHKFQKQRKDKKQKISNNISNIEAQVREMIKERDFLQNVLLQNDILISSHVSLAESQFQDTETFTQNQDRSTRRHIDVYVSLQELSRYTVVARSLLSA